MSIRPIDVQVNIMKEGDNAKNVQKDKLHQDGQARFTPQLQKEKEIQNENVQNLEKSESKNINEQDRGKKGGGAQNKKKRPPEKKREEKIDVENPNLGKMIDIKS